MRIDYDPAKNGRNIRNRRLPFDRAAEFDFETALFHEDIRNSYPERRFVALGFLDARLHVLCFAYAPGGIRVISFRKANAREIKHYEQETADR